MIKIWFTDFWDGFNPYDNYFTRILSKNYELYVTDKDPDFLIYSWVSKDYYNYKNCVRIFFTGENIRPDYSVCDYSISFDYDSFDDRNFRLPLYVLYGESSLLTNKPSPEVILSQNRSFCNFVYSNNRAKQRKEFFDLLSKYKKIDSGGKVLNNLGYQVDNKIEFIKKYKFTIAFENSSYQGYTTEKIFEPMMVQSIPIYWGNPNIKEDFNTKSFVNVHDYGSLHEVVDKIIEIDQDNSLYSQILSEPFFVNNKPTKYFDEQRLIDFFNPIFNKGVKNKLHDINIQKQIAISVIVPVYNTENYVHDCIMSIINQNFDNYEIICINDGTKDNSEKILSELGKKHDEIRIINQENQGLSAARNTGLKYANGKYVLFVDSDDKLNENALQEMYEKAELMELDVLGFNYSDQNGNSRDIKSPVTDQILDGKTFYMLYYDANKDFPLSASCLYLYKKRFLDVNKLKFKVGIYHEDEHFFVRLLAVCDKIFYLNKTLYWYRMDRTDSIMLNRSLKNCFDLNSTARDLYYYLKYNNINDKLFYRKIYQLYFTSATIFSYANKTGKNQFMTKEDEKIMSACIQNFTNFYYYSLISKDIRFFKSFVLNKKPYLVSKMVLWGHKLYYCLFANQYRMS